MSSKRRLDLLILSIAFTGSGLTSVYLGQKCDWDLRNYHYYNAYAFLNGRLTFDIAPAQLQSFLNPILDVPFYWMMNALRPVVYGFLVGGLTGLNIWLVYRITHSLLAGLSDGRRRLLSLASAFTGYFGAASVFEVGTSFHDNVTSLFVLGAILLVVEQPALRSKRRLAAAGVLLGVATGLKLVVAIYALAFTVCLLVLDSTWRRKLTNVLISGLGILLGATLSIGPWMSRLWREFESPVFPLYNAVFKSPYYELRNFTDDRYLPRYTYQALLYPFYFLPHPEYVSESAFRDIRFPLCYLLLVLLLFVAYYKRVYRAYGGHAEIPASSGRITGFPLFVLAFCVFSYALWQTMFSLYRYIIPLELLAPLFILLIVRYIFPFERVFARVSLGVFALIVLTMQPMGGWRGGRPWSAGHFAVGVPRFPGIDLATVIMADDAPLSYVIPAFPKGTRFVSVKNNFTRPTAQTKLQEKVREALALGGNGDLYLLYKAKSRENYAGVLAAYGLRMRAEEKARVTTRCDDDLYLIPVSRTQRGDQAR